MLVILRVESGPASGKNCTLRSGQRVRVGSTAHADFSVAGDLALASKHFEIAASNDGCTLSTIDGENVKLNDVDVSQTALSSGDRIIAGSSTFSVTIEGVAASAQQTQEEVTDTAEEATSGFENVQETSTAVICAGLNLTAAGIALAEENMPPGEFVAALKAGGHTRDAICFLAAALAPNAAVAWGAQCLSPLEGDSAALQAAKQWASDPSDQARQAAAQAATENGPTTPGGYLAQAVTYTAELAPDVPAPPSLLAVTMTGALELAVAGDTALLEEFLTQGIAAAAPSTA